MAITDAHSTPRSLEKISRCFPFRWLRVDEDPGTKCSYIYLSLTYKATFYALRDSVSFNDIAIQSPNPMTPAHETICTDQLPDYSSQGAPGLNRMLTLVMTP